MIIINSVSNTLFSFNGIEYFRNYISVVRGERIEIFNCYERDDVMLPLTHYSEVSLNGITYSNASDLQSVLQTVIYSRATLGSDEVEVVEQNNVGKIIYLDYVSGSDLLTQVLGDINSQTTLISATDNPVYFTAYKSATTASVAQKLRFQFMGGKGTWGAGGSAVLPSHLYQLPPESLLPEDITANNKSNVISLGQITNETEFLTKVNSTLRDLTDTSKLHYFSYSLDSILYIKRFTGQPGEYDGAQTILTETDFNDATNSNVQPGLYLPTLKDITAIDSFTDTPITITDNNTGDNITFSGSSVKHTSVDGSKTTLDYQPNSEDVTYSIPAKSTDDVFAMQSDVNGITIVTNQSASELYLKNVDGTILATINLGFLNNEGTTFFYNETSEKLELKNDDGEVLSEVPVSAFVANLMQSVNFNGATPQTLEFKDAEGNVVDSVTFTVSNIQGLQNALDGKINITHPSNNITSVNLTDWQKAFTDYISRRESSPVTTEVFNGDMNTMNKGTYMTTMSTTATNKPFLDVGGLISVGSATLGFQILGSRTGNELWFRPYTSTYGSWYRLWNSEDFTLTGELEASEDLNTYTETGIYTQDSNVDASGGTNYPTPYAGILKVFRKGDFIWQRYHSYSLQNEVFHRGRNSSGSWVSWVRSWDTSDFSQSNITNWNTAFGWGDFRNFGLGEFLLPVTDLISSDTNVNRFFRFLSSANGSGGFAGGAVSIRYDNTPSTSFIGANGSYAFVGYKNGENATPQFYKLWDARNFTQSDVNNWNSAYNRGDFRDYGLGSGLASNTALENDILIFNTTGIFRVASTAINLPETDNGFIYRMYRGGNNAYVVFYSDSGKIFKNIKDGSSWSGWERILSSGDITIDSSIGDAQDLNNFTKTGNYSQTLNAQAATGSNYPVPYAGMLEVFSNNITSGGGIKVYQKYHSYNNELYIRGNSAGVWSFWSKITKSSDLSGYLAKSGGTMTGAIKYGNPSANQISFLGTQLAGTEIGYTAWMLQNLDYDSTNQKFTKPRANLLSLALALGTGDKALRLMYAPNAVSNGDEADLSTVFSVDSQGRIITQEHGTSEQWNEVYSDKNNYLRNQADGAPGNVMGGASFADLNNLLTGIAWVSNTISNLPSGQAFHVISLAGTDSYQSQLALRSSNFYFRSKEADSWQSWKRIWHSGDFTQSNIDNWNTAYNRGDFKDYGIGVTAPVTYPMTDLNDTSVPNGTYAVVGASTSNTPITNSGTITVERYSTYITQKYQAVNQNDVVRMFIRHYKTGSASWTPWREIWTDENFSPNDKAEVNDTLSFKGTIPSGDNINNYTVNGFYSTDSSTVTNLPVEDKGILTVASNGNYNSQTYTNYNSNEFYFRTSNPAGGWNSWERAAKSSERIINDTLSTPPSSASLNALYPSANATFTVIAPNVEKGNMYVKTDDGWLVFIGNRVY
ncbi:pyocin knob domain-containing protein [Flavobacterium sp. ST-75]|uniref:Pyocin knob domain-containing protein n=1 Tax=Flavobacterium rhizophilum TaxID=3163296 RepID=A0ABW8YAZ5_9FLAO